MAKRTEEVVLDLSIEQKDSLSELEKLKKGIVGLKEEQKQLTDAYKKGAITLDEYSKGITRVDSNLKLQTSQYNRVQKSVTGVKSEMDKLIESNKKLSSTTGDAIKQINIAGVSVGSLSTSMQAYLNPATAAIGVTGLLFTAYAKSTIGAKDLEFAHHQLAAATTIVTNQFASLVSSAEDGEGAITKLFNRALTFVAKFPAFAVPRGILSLVGIDIGKTQEESKQLALIAEDLEDLGRQEVDLKSAANERLAENQELLTEIQSDQTSYNDKLLKASKIIENLRASQVSLTNEKANELSIIQDQLDADEHNETLLTKRGEILKQLSAIEKDSEKRIQNVVRLQQNLNEAEEKKLKLARENAVTGGKKMTLVLPKEEEADALADAKDFADMLVQVTSDMGGEEVKIYEMTADAKIEADKRVAENKKKTSQEELAIERTASETKLMLASTVAAGVAGIFRQGSAAQKIFALTSIALDTAAAISALTRNAQANPANSVTFNAAGAAQFVAGIAQIFSNIAMAKRYISGKAAGGGDFVTSGPALLMVGDNPGGRERVTVEPLSGKGQTQIYPHSGIVAMAGGGTMTAGGSSIAHSITSPINMSFKGNQIPKQMFVSWAEGKQMDRMVAFKEKLTTV